MKLRRIIASVVAAVLIAGLVVAPVVTAAKSAASVEMAGITSMAKDMPCCPDEQKSKDCQDCPLMAMCVLKVVQLNSSAADAAFLRLPFKTIRWVHNDAPVSGLDHPPPDHPPRIVI